MFSAGGTPSLLRPLALDFTRSGPSGFGAWRDPHPRISVSAVEIRDLGPLRVEVDQLEIPLPGRRLASVLALLAAEVGRAVTPDELIEAIWGDLVPAHAGKALETLVWRLRSVLEPGRVPGTEATLLRTDTVGYRLHLQAESVDSRRLKEALPQVVSLLTSGRPAEALELSGAALALWRGEPFQGVPDASWMTSARQELVERRVDLAECHVEALLETGQPEEAIRELGPLLTGYPFRERFWVQRMVALYRSGRQADALETYVDARRVLDEELGVEPGPELRATHEQVLAHAESLGPVPFRPRVELVVVPSRLPRRPEGTVGRDDDLLALSEWLDDAGLVTLVGPGGVGKTRLAVEAAYRQRSRFPGGVWFVDLTVVSTTEATVGRVADEIAAVLELSPAPGVSSSQAVAQGLAERQLLLVIDNCEHVLDSAATVVEELMNQCPEVTFLATTRVPLEVPGEREFAVSPLADDQAVALFAQRLSGLRPDLDPDGDDRAPITAICAAVGGLPLGIELAAARARVFELSEVVASLAESPAALGRRGRGPARHSSLLETVDWSYRLARPEEQALHRRLVLVPGPITLGAATAMTSVAPLRTDLTAELLAGLVHRSLLTSSRPARPGGRTLFRQLVPTRSHADSLLHDPERAAVAAARDDWVRCSLHAAALDGRPGQADSSAWVDDNLAAVRATLSSMLIDGADPAGIALVIRLMLYWFERGQMLEASRWCRAAVDRVTQGVFSGFDVTLALAVDACSRALIQDRAVVAERFAGFVETLTTPPDELATLAGELLILLAISAWICQNPIAGRAAADAAITVGDQFGEPHIVVRARALRSMHQLIAGQAEQAVSAAASILADPAGNEFAVFVATYVNAVAAREVGDARAGLFWMRRLAQAHRTLAMHPSSELLENLAQILELDGSRSEAVRCYAVAAALHSRDGLPWPRLPFSQPIVDRLRDELPTQYFDHLWESGRRLARGEPTLLLDVWLAPVG